MEQKRLRTLLKALIEKSIDKGELLELSEYLFNMLRHTSKNLAREFEKSLPESDGEDTHGGVDFWSTLLSWKGYIGSDGREIIEDFLVYMLLKRHSIEVALESHENIKAYLYNVARSFLVDTYRRLSREIRFIRLSDFMEEDEETSHEEMLDSLSKEKKKVRAYEFIELECLVRGCIQEGELKYLCYQIDSDRYKCLWGNKSKDAIYKDVSRKKGKVNERLRNALVSAGVGEELFKEFVDKVMSGWCEEMRSKYCKEELP